MPLDGTAGWRGTDGRLWSKQDDIDLLAARAKAVPWRDIAVQLGRPSGPTCRARFYTITHRAYLTAEKIARIEARTGQAKDRTCLMCGNTFPSESAANRRCGPCYAAEAEVDSTSWLKPVVVPFRLRLPDMRGERDATPLTVFQKYT